MTDNTNFSEDPHATMPVSEGSASVREQVPAFLRQQTAEIATILGSTNAPALLSPQPENIPAELSDIPQWLVWRGEWIAPHNGKAGKLNKVPFQIGGGKARVNDSATWATFPAALRAYLDSQDPKFGTAPFSGLGFVLTRENGIVGLDFDDVIDPETGELKPSMIAIIESLNSYTEVSPSGTGLRIFVRGKLPPSGRVRGQSDGSKFEVYDGGRYVTVTGRKLPGVPDAIEDRRAQLLEFHAQHIASPDDGAGESGASIPAGPPPLRPVVANALTDDELLQKARDSRNGTRFLALWVGDLADPELATYNGDHSSADLALCSNLAFWAGRDPDRIDRLFRQSGLMREKWNVRHSSDGRTYGQMTIERAINSCEGCFGQRQPGAFGNVVFPHITADDIPAAKGSAGKDSIYGEGQLLEMLHPDWNVGSLTSEAAHAARFARAFDGDLRHCSQLGWLKFDGIIWERDDRKSSRTVSAMVALSQVVREEVTRLYQLSALLSKAGRASDAAAMALAAKVHARHVKTTETNRFIRDTLSIAAGTLHISVETFNARPFRLAFKNLVWDRGERRPHRRDDYLLAVSPIEIPLEVASDISHEVALETVSDATVSDDSAEDEWLAVLRRISNGDAELERTLQDVVGYALSGSSDLRTILWFYGEGGTGKSTISELCETVLAEGVYPVRPNHLGRSGDRERLGCSLWNCFLAVCSESGNQKLDVEVLKLLSGADTLSARFLYQEPFNVHPTHALLMLSNDAPYLDAYDKALKDRVLVLPFDHALSQGGMLQFGKEKNARIEKVRKDPQSELVRGFAEWALVGVERIRQTKAIHRCAVVAAATKKFWADTDPLGEFWDSIPLQIVAVGIAKGTLRGIYEEWCEDNGQARAFSPILWVRACESVGLVEERRDTKGTRYWVLPAAAAEKLWDKASAELGEPSKTVVPNIYGERISYQESIYRKLSGVLNPPPPLKKPTAKEVEDLINFNINDLNHFNSDDSTTS